MTTQLFANWIAETRKLQEEAYHLDYGHFDNGVEAEPDRIVNLVDHISMNVTAAIHELVELQSETSWKPWQADRPYAHREQIRGEAVDVLHFIANILAAIDVSDEELDKAYRAKMDINRERQARRGGYLIQADGVKCRVCKRALDDVPAAFDDETICMACKLSELTNA